MQQSKFTSVLLLATLLQLIVCSEYVSSLASDSFNWKLGNIAAVLSSHAYCDTGDLMDQKFTGYATGFIPTYRIEGVDNQGFVGYLSSYKTIFVVYSGTKSAADWVFNVEEALVDYPKCSECQVHSGFFAAEELTIFSVAKAVFNLKLRFPSYKTVVTGHSKGAAQATFAALDLLDMGVKPVKMINFGSPRVGNKKFAEYASRRLSTVYRITHRKDTIPHFPTEHAGFVHISGEWYEDPTRVVRECHGFEDKQCAARWSTLETSLADHMRYLGVHMLCPAPDASPVHFEHTKGIEMKSSGPESAASEELGSRKSSFFVVLFYAALMACFAAIFTVLFWFNRDRFLTKFRYTPLADEDENKNHVEPVRVSDSYMPPTRLKSAQASVYVSAGRDCSNPREDGSLENGKSYQSLELCI